MNHAISFYPYLTEPQRELLDRSLVKETFRKGQLVHRHGDSCVGLIFVRSGRLAFSVLSEEGREITLFRVDPGSTCILSAACVLQVMEMESSISAEVPTEVSILPAAVLSQIMQENPDVERIIYKLAVQRFSSVVKTLQQILFFSLEKRLALFLLDEMQRGNSATLSATHEQIARYIGSSREVVTRTLNQFANRGLVTLGRGTVTVVDRESLTDLTF